MNRSKTGKALLISVLSILLCVALLSGVTFAWFTDNASTGVSSIQTGTLEVELQKKTGEDSWAAVGSEPLEFNLPDGKSEILWEPNAAYELPTLRIVNEGNLALKYKLEFTSADGDIDLADVLQVKVNTTTLTDSLGALLTGEAEERAIIDGTLAAGATSDEISISIIMKESADISYASKKISGIKLKVFATQNTVESDSYDNTYDADAAYYDFWDGSIAPTAYLAAVTDTANKTVKISSAELLAAFAKSVNNGNNYWGYTVTLETNIDLQNKDWTPIGKSNAYKANDGSCAFSGTFDGQNHTIANLKCNGGVANPTDPAATCQGLFACLYAAGNSVEIKNIHIHNADVYALNAAGAAVGRLDTYQHVSQSGMAVISGLKLTGKVTIKGGNSGSVAGSPVSNWPIYTQLHDITVDVDNGSYVSNVDVSKVGEASPSGIIGGVIALGVQNMGSYSIKSNIDVIANDGFVGGVVGLANGKWSNIECTGDITIKSVSPEARLTYGTIIGSFVPGQGNLDKNSSIASGSLRIEYTDGTVGESNGQESNLLGINAW